MNCRLALIGCGDVVATYAAAIPRLRHMSVVATADTDVANARRAAEALQAPISAGSLDELLRDHGDAFDAVLIHTAADSHDRLAGDAARAGKHVFVETPLALSTAAAGAVVDACARADVRLMIGQNFRYLPSTRVVWQSHAAGRLGEPGLLRLHHWLARSADAAGNAPMEPLANGVALLARDVVCLIDLANWFFGRLPTCVQCLARPGRHDSRTTEAAEYLQLHLGFENGGSTLIDVATGLPAGSGYFSLSLIGSTGAAYADDHHNAHLLFGGGHPAALYAEQGNSHVVVQLQEFADAIAERRDPAVSGAAGRQAVQVAEAAAHALAAGNVAHLKDGSYELA